MQSLHYSLTWQQLQRQAVRTMQALFIMGDPKEQQPYK